MGETDSPWKELVGQVYLGTEEWMESVRARLRSNLHPVEHARVQRDPIQRTMNDVLQSVAVEFESEPTFVRTSHGGFARMAAAWLGRYEAHLTLESIGAALRVRSAGHVTNIVKQCDAALDKDTDLKERIERCITRLYAVWKTGEPKT
jgi:hypothetical protein